MAFTIFHPGKRGYDIRCAWIRSAPDDGTELPLKDEKVWFWARHIYDRRDGNEDNGIRYGVDRMSVETLYDLHGIKQGDRVECEGRTWRVDAVYSDPIENSMEYMTRPREITRIEMAI